MTTTTPDNEPLELGEPDSLAGTFTDQIATLKRDLAAAHEELNTQAHELERLLNELSAAQERIREFKEASAGLTRNQVGLLNSLAHANERAQAAEARAEANERDAEVLRAIRGWLDQGATIKAQSQPCLVWKDDWSIDAGLIISYPAIAEGK